MASQQIGIYKITSPTGRIYIGQSWDIASRIRKYKSFQSTKKQRVLHNSIKKYGWEAHNFEFICIFPIDIDQAVLDKYEIFCISQFKEAGCKMMNIKDGGLGGKLPEKSIKKMLKTRGEWSHTEETKKRISESHKGIKHSLEAKAKMKGNKNSAKVILHKDTGIFYFGAKEAALAFNLKSRTLSRILQGRAKNNVNLIYV